MSVFRLTLSDLYDEFIFICDVCQKEFSYETSDLYPKLPLGWSEVTKFPSVKSELCERCTWECFQK